MTSRYTTQHFRPRALLPALALAAVAALAACDDALTTEPVDAIPSERQITDSATARASLVGMYDALQELGYYGRTFLVMGDLSADNAEHIGTFQYLGQADRNQLQADNSAVASIWTAIYASVARANQIIAKVPAIEMNEADRDEIVGEAYFVRALGFHNLVKFWGDVPMPLAPITSADDAAKVTRTPKAEVYTQILADLASAESRITSPKQTRQASLGAVRAIRARVQLYQGNWQGALDAANAVLAMGYTLAPNYAELNTAEGTDTPEDIFRVTFTPQEYSEMGYWYLRGSGGRWEVGPEPELVSQFEAGDVRKNITATARNAFFFSRKWPTSIGGEDIHVIRLGEVILIKAEALARLGGAANLQAAVAEYNKIRVRARLAPHVYGTNVTTQAEVLAAIDKERRLELALEGDRFPDLVRTGRAAAVLGLDAEHQYQLLYPIPASERLVAPGLGQNDGY